MRLIQKKDTLIPNDYGDLISGCIMDVVRYWTDENNNFFVEVGIYSSQDAVNIKAPFRTFVVDFSEKPLLQYDLLLNNDGSVKFIDGVPQYSQDPNHKSHRGSIFVINNIDFMVVKNGILHKIILKDLSMQQWYVNYKIMNSYKIGDLFEFEDGFLPE